MGYSDRLWGLEGHVAVLLIAYGKWEMAGREGREWG